MSEYLTPAVVVPVVIALIGTGGFGVLVGAILTHRRETKRDKASVMVQHAEHLQKHLEHQDAEVARLSAEQHRLWDARRADALTIRAQGDHIDVLEAHIWAGKPPPPPPRPPGV